MWEKKDVNIDSTNIFDEFSADEKIKKEVELKEKQKEKNIWYYISTLSNFFVVINMIILLIFIIIFWYIYIQKDETITDASYLTPICPIFVSDQWNYENCSSVSSLINDYKTKNNNISKTYYEKNKELIEKIYQNFKFVDSKEVHFLISRTKNRLKVLEILSEFDKIKYQYSPLSKTIISCEGINISSDFTLNIKCSAYSWNWDDEILWYSWKNTWQDIVNGTSISVASSFINFIEKMENSNFFILEKPKQFNSIDIVNDYWYAKKTDFNLKLKYNNNNNILLKK